MPRKSKNIHYLYKITCDITNRFYFGIHSTNNLDDGYFGGGVVLRRSVRKYGEENHTKIILEYADNRDILEDIETNIISEHINDTLCMNLTLSGKGFKSKHLDSTKRKISDTLFNKTYEEIHGIDKAEFEKKKRKEGVKKSWDKASDEYKRLRANHVSKGLIEYYKKNPIKLDEVKCPYCGKTGKGLSMKRWHFDNCKLKAKQR